ncbi:MAG TPA: polysaccharide biosynthesis C-terminal domain-containing protein [Solirubrobacterales bacterium]|nr:polysaccharide biosynthesis C-terminal domain-containing protein [Solirubrobacterales bacterium]
MSEGARAEPHASAAMGSGGRLLGFRLVQFVFLFLLSLIATRALGPEGRGQYALALNLATMVWVISHLSIEQSVARMMGRKEASLEQLCRLASFSALSLGLLGIAATLAIGLPARDALLGGANTATVVLAAVTIPFTLIGQMATALLLRLGMLRPYGWTIAVGAVFQFLLVVGLELGVGLSPQLTMLAALVSIAAVALALALALARRVGVAALSPFVEPRLVRSALHIGVRLQPSSIALWLNLKVDLFLVGLLASTDQAGLYSLSASLADIVFTAVSTVALAALEAQTHAEEETAASYTLDFISQNISVAVLLGLAAALISYPFIVVVYGSEWQGSVLPFVLLMPAVIALAIEEPARGLLIRIAPPLVISAAAAAGLALNVGLNFVLIPAVGISGASLASVASYWLAGILMLYLLSRYGRVPMRDAMRLPRRDDALPRLLRRAVG